MNKNNYTISNVDIDKIKKYIEQTNDTTSNLKDSNDINVILDKYEQDLNEIIKYVKKTYNASICLFGCSFGGFVILNKLIYDQECAYKTILMCPAINFSEILEKKANISIEYYNSNLYMPLYNNIKIYKKAYLEFKNGTEKIKNGHFENIAIIQGFADKTVLCENVKKFCKDKRIKLKIIKNGKHELYGFDKEIVEFLLKNLN